MSLHFGLSLVSRPSSGNPVGYVAVVAVIVVVFVVVVVEFPS